MKSHTLGWCLCVFLVVVLTACNEEKVGPGSADSEVRIEEPGGLVNEAIERLDPNAPVDTAEEHYQRATKYIRNGRSDLAHEQLLKAFAKDKTHAAVHVSLGYTYLNVKRDLRKGSYHLEQSLLYGVEVADQVRAHLGLGIVFTKLGIRRVQEEENPALMIKRYNTTNPKGHLSSYELFTKAKRHFMTVKQLDPDNYKVVFEMGMLELAQNNYDNSVRYFEHYLKVEGTSNYNARQVTYEALALVKEGQGDLMGAIEYLKKSMKAYPVDVLKNREVRRVGRRLKNQIAMLEEKLLTMELPISDPPKNNDK